MGGTDTGATVLHGLVGDAELTKVVADHLRLKMKGNKLFHGTDILNNHCNAILI